MTLGRPATPPMGWNSWDSYGTTITEAEVLANAEFMAEHLLPFGWDTIVIDADWSDPSAHAHGYTDEAPLALDEYGRLVPDPGRFPSSAGGAGFGPLAARLHALGLRLGIHVMRGIPRRAVALDTPILGSPASAAAVADPTNVCEWNPHYLGLRFDGRPGAREYYDSCVALWASWGVDFVKADDLLWPYQAADVEALSGAIERSARTIELSLSPGRDLSLARLEHLRAHATMWRVCDDVWDRWEDVAPNFARFARWAPFAREGAWPDGDMLPLGRIGIRAERGEPRDDGLLPAERRTLVTLWVIARSPLMIGGDLPQSDPETIALFTNPEVLEVLTASTGNRELFREGPLVLWGAAGDGDARYVAAFNTGESALSLALDTRNIGLPAALTGELVDLWSGEPVTSRPVSVQSDDARGVAPGGSAVDVTLEPHGCALLRYSTTGV